MASRSFTHPTPVVLTTQNGCGALKGVHMKHLLKIAWLFLLLAVSDTAAFAAVSVSLSPNPGEVVPGGQLQFLATVSGTYGDYLLNKVSKVFPQLRAKVL